MEVTRTKLSQHTCSVRTSVTACTIVCVHVLSVLISSMVGFHVYVSYGRLSCVVTNSYNILMEVMSYDS